MTVALITPIGFKAWKQADVLRTTQPEIVHLLRSDAPEAAKNAQRVRTWAKRNAAKVEETIVRPAFSFVAWYRAVDAAAATLEPHGPIVNLTAGHGIAISMASAVAMKRSLDCVCYDKVAGRVHYANPGVIASFGALVDLDRSILRTLREHAETVSGLASRLALPFSTTSAAARRLAARGWLRSKQAGKEVTYSLRPGVAEFLETLVI